MNNGDILFFVFIFIFVATAIITLASLPGWIKIPDSYRKVLFSALLLEVVACVILSYRYLNLEENDKKGISQMSDTMWVAIRPDGEIFRPQTNDSHYLGMDVSDFRKKAAISTYYNLHRKENPNDAARTDYVLRKDNTGFGIVAAQSLMNLGLFDGIRVEGDGFARVKFTESETGWSKNNGINKNWNIDVRMENSKYIITDRENSVQYASGTEFNSLRRETHFFKALDNEFYLVRISDAQLNKSPKFVSFFILRLEQTLTK